MDKLEGNLMKSLRWFILVGIITYQPVHTSLEELAAGFVRAPYTFGDGGSCDPAANSNC